MTDDRRRISRRRFLGITGTTVAAALGEGFLREPTAIAVSRHDLVVPGLAPALAGLRVACLSDVHLHGGVSRAARAASERLAHERPDVVVLAGDVCNRRSDLPHLSAWAREARGTRATFATLGNWEHDAGIDRATAAGAYGRSGVELLYNSRGRVVVGGAALTIVGIDDPVLGEPDVAAAVATLAAGDPALWVVHAPGFVDTIPRGVYPQPLAVLAGHTHGGQVRLPFWTPYTPEGSGRFVAGWYRDTLAPLYVTRGIGTVVLPARFCSPPELAIFTLVSGRS
ncbi:MAG TPA: metallophosphoesterase [Gemmatimonadales bacterium]